MTLSRHVVCFVYDNVARIHRNRHDDIGIRRLCLFRFRTRFVWLQYITMSASVVQIVLIFSGYVYCLVFEFLWQI
jgi:hypothetical protein